jgi:hypothetical protein
MINKQGPQQANFAKLGEGDFVIGRLFAFPVLDDIHVCILLLGLCAEVLDASSRPKDEDNRLHHRKKARDEQEDGSLSIETILFHFASFRLDGILNPNEQDHNDEAIIRETEKGQTEGLELANCHSNGVSHIQQAGKES